MAANILYFGDRLDFSPMKGYEACVFADDQYSDSLSFLIEKMATAIYEICYAMDHSTGMYFEYQEYLNAYMNKFGGFSPQYQMWYDPYSNGYDQGWWDDSNFNYATRPMGFQQQESQ